MRSIRRLVEYPGSSGTRTTLQPSRSTSPASRRGGGSVPALPPNTTTSGKKRAMKSCGEPLSTAVTKSTAARAARISARSASGWIGRSVKGQCGALPLPNRARAARSPSIATTRIFPRLFAYSRSRIWPGCSRSKQPLAHTTPSPACFHPPRREINSACEKTCPKRMPVGRSTGNAQTSDFSTHAAPRTVDPYYFRTAVGHASAIFDAIISASRASASLRLRESLSPQDRTCI